MHIYIYIYIYIYEGGLKNPYEVISAVDDFFDQWDQSTATPIEEVCGHYLLTFHESIFVNL